MLGEIEFRMSYLRNKGSENINHKYHNKCQ